MTAASPRTVTYWVETLCETGMARHWERLPDAYFETEAEAEVAIQRLLGLGDDWATGEYRVVLHHEDAK